MNKEESHAYEISFLISEENVSKIKDILEKNGAKILGENILEKSRLAYPIEKQSQAYAGNINFEIDPMSLEKLGAGLKLEGGILRSLVTKLDLKNIPKETKELRPETSQRRRPISLRKKPENTGLTNEALEKKIEEILK